MRPTRIHARTPHTARSGSLDESGHEILSPVGRRVMDLVDQTSTVPSTAVERGFHAGAVHRTPAAICVRGFKSARVCARVWFAGLFSLQGRPRAALILQRRCRA